MTITIFSRNWTGFDASGLPCLAEALGSGAVDYLLDREFAGTITRMTGYDIPEKCLRDDFDSTIAEADIAVSYGGDGTFLECVGMLKGSEIPLLGINSGRLGFLANVPLDGMISAFSDLAAGRYSVEKRILLEAAGDICTQGGGTYAFNEFSVQRSGTSMLSVEAFVNGEMVATYWGDGVILATPSGSTAYSLSVGGPIVAPECNCLVMAPIAPHNLTMRPVVIPDDSTVEFIVSSRDGKALAAMDNVKCEIRDKARIRVRKSRHSVFLVKLQNISFYDTLRNKMLWGIDRRDGK